MVYHSTFSSANFERACGCALPPIRASASTQQTEYPGKDADILDEAIAFFRANVLFRKFDIHGDGDRLLIYLTLFVNQCLKRLESTKSKGEGQKVLGMFLSEHFAIPGVAGFPLNGILSPPTNRDEGEHFRAYLKQARTATAGRLLDKCYLQDGTQNKFWFAFSKRKFMNMN